MVCAKDIKIINPNNGSFIYIQTESLSAGTIRFSPDGQILSYYENMGLLRFVDVASLTEINALPIQSLLGIRGYEWSPTGEYIAILNQPDSTSPQNLYLLHTETWHYEQITNGMDVSSFVSWSPDGERLLFSASVTGDLASSDIYMLHIGDHEMSNLTNNQAFNMSPDWSSDGQRIVHIMGGGRADSIVIRTRETVEQVIDIETDWFGLPEWALDDNYIMLFIQDENSILHLLDPTSQTLTMLANGASMSGYDLSENGREVVFLTTAPDNRLCILDLITNDEQCFEDETPYFAGVPVWQSS